jgi:hypothetical protein
LSGVRPKTSCMTHDRCAGRGRAEHGAVLAAADEGGGGSRRPGRRRGGWRRAPRHSRLPRRRGSCRRRSTPRRGCSGRSPALARTRRWLPRRPSGPTTEGSGDGIARPAVAAEHRGAVHHLVGEAGHLLGEAEFGGVDLLPGEGVIQHRDGVRNGLRSSSVPTNTLPFEFHSPWWALPSGGQAVATTWSHSA